MTVIRARARCEKCASGNFHTCEKEPDHIAKCWGAFDIENHFDAWGHKPIPLLYTFRNIVSSALDAWSNTFILYLSLNVSIFFLKKEKTKSKFSLTVLYKGKKNKRKSRGWFTWHRIHSQGGGNASIFALLSREYGNLPGNLRFKAYNRLACSKLSLEMPHFSSNCTFTYVYVQSQLPRGETSDNL